MAEVALNLVNPLPKISPQVKSESLPLAVSLPRNLLPQENVQRTIQFAPMWITNNPVVTFQEGFRNNFSIKGVAEQAAIGAADFSVTAVAGAAMGITLGISWPVVLAAIGLEASVGLLVELGRVGGKLGSGLILVLQAKDSQSQAIESFKLGATAGGAFESLAAVAVQRKVAGYAAAKVKAPILNINHLPEVLSGTLSRRDGKLILKLDRRSSKLNSPEEGANTGQIIEMVELPGSAAGEGVLVPAGRGQSKVPELNQLRLETHRKRLELADRYRRELGSSSLFVEQLIVGGPSSGIGGPKVRFKPEPHEQNETVQLPANSPSDISQVGAFLNKGGVLTSAKAAELLRRGYARNYHSGSAIDALRKSDELTATEMREATVSGLVESYVTLARQPRDPSEGLAGDPARDIGAVTAAAIWEGLIDENDRRQVALTAIGQVMTDPVAVARILAPQPEPPEGMLWDLPYARSFRSPSGQGHVSPVVQSAEHLPLTELATQQKSSFHIDLLLELLRLDKVRHAGTYARTVVRNNPAMLIDFQSDSRVVGEVTRLVSRNINLAAEEFDGRRENGINNGIRLLRATFELLLAVPLKPEHFGEEYFANWKQLFEVLWERRQNDVYNGNSLYNLLLLAPRPDTATLYQQYPEMLSFMRGRILDQVQVSTVTSDDLFLIASQVALTPRDVLLNDRQFLADFRFHIGGILSEAVNLSLAPKTRPAFIKFAAHPRDPEPFFTAVGVWLSIFPLVPKLTLRDTELREVVARIERHKDTAGYPTREELTERVSRILSGEERPAISIDQLPDLSR